MTDATDTVSKRQRVERVTTAPLSQRDAAPYAVLLMGGQPTWPPIVLKPSGLASSPYFSGRLGWEATSAGPRQHTPIIVLAAEEYGALTEGAWAMLGDVIQLWDVDAGATAPNTTTGASDAAVVLSMLPKLFAELPPNTKVLRTMLCQRVRFPDLIQLWCDGEFPWMDREPRSVEHWWYALVHYHHSAREPRLRIAPETWRAFAQTVTLFRLHNVLQTIRRIAWKYKLQDVCPDIAESAAEADSLIVSFGGSEFDTSGAGWERPLSSWTKALPQPQAVFHDLMVGTMDRSLMTAMDANVGHILDVKRFLRQHLLEPLGLMGASHDPIMHDWMKRHGILFSGSSVWQPLCQQYRRDFGLPPLELDDPGDLDCFVPRRPSRVVFLLDTVQLLASLIPGFIETALVTFKPGVITLRHETWKRPLQFIFTQHGATEDLFTEVCGRFDGVHMQAGVTHARGDFAMPALTAWLSEFTVYDAENNAVPDNARLKRCQCQFAEVFRLTRCADDATYEFWACVRPQPAATAQYMAQGLAADTKFTGLTFLLQEIAGSLLCDIDAWAPSSWGAYAICPIPHAVWVRQRPVRLRLTTSGHCVSAVRFELLQPEWEAFLRLSQALEAWSQPRLKQSCISEPSHTGCDACCVSPWRHMWSKTFKFAANAASGGGSLLVQRRYITNAMYLDHVLGHDKARAVFTKGCFKTKAFTQAQVSSDMLLLPMQVGEAFVPGVQVFPHVLSRDALWTHMFRSSRTDP